MCSVQYVVVPLRPKHHLLQHHPHPRLQQTRGAAGRATPALPPVRQRPKLPHAGSFSQVSVGRGSAESESRRARPNLPFHKPTVLQTPSSQTQTGSRSFPIRFLDREVPFSPVTFHTSCSLSDRHELVLRGYLVDCNHTDVNVEGVGYREFNITQG